MAPSTTKILVWNRALDRVGESDGIESETENRPAANVCGRHWDDILREVFEARIWKWAKRLRALTQIDSQTRDAAGDGAQRNFDIPFGYLSTLQLTVQKVAVGGGLTTLVAGTDYTITSGAADGVTDYITLTGAAPTVGQSIRITVTTARVGWEHVYALPADCVTPIGLVFEETRYELLPVDGRVEFALMPNDKGDGQILCCNLEADDFDALEYVALIDTVPMWPRKFVDAVAWRLAVELALALRKDPKMADYCNTQFIRALDEADAQTDDIGDSQEPVTPSMAARGAFPFSAGAPWWLLKNVR